MFFSTAFTISAPAPKVKLFSIALVAGQANANLAVTEALADPWLRIVISGSWRLCSLSPRRAATGTLNRCVPTATV